MVDHALRRRLDEAKMDYFNNKYDSQAQLAEKYDLSIHTLVKYIRVGNDNERPWREQKAEIEQELKKEALQTSRLNLSKIFRYTSEIVLSALTELKYDLAIRCPHLDPEKKAKIVKDLMHGWHTIFSDYRLMENQSTQNIAVKSESERAKEAWKTLDDLGLSPASSDAEDDDE